MLIILDLDGTLINTVHPSWKPYKDGQEGYSIEPILAQIPVFPGAREFILSRRGKGDKVVVVSDSHHRYVNPICNLFEVDCVSLADKPNTQKIYELFVAHPDYKQELDNGNCVVVGDTKLDIELGRRLGAMTVWFLPYQITDEIRDERDGIGDELLCKKMGPTFAAKSFEEIESILDNPLSHLYAIEAACVGMESTRSIRLNYNRYGDGSFASIRCLARQEEGASDKYARAVSYYMLSNPQRTPEFLQTMSKGISCYINQPLLMERGWDYFTYLTDKSTTTPPNKMRELFDMVETTIPKLQLLKWADDVQGSLREQNLYADRRSFLQRYLTVDCPADNNFSLMGKNIIVLDDQLTTGATAWHVIRSLKEKGAKNVLFIAMFQMVLPVHNNVICPRCGKPMLIKMRRSDGHRFYSCTPPEYRGDGCGYILDIESNPVDQKFLEIQRKYPWGYDRFKIGRDTQMNFKQLVVDSESDIQLIEKMGMYNTGASDEDIRYMREILRKGEEMIFQNPKRNSCWEEFIGYHSHCDYWDSYGYSLEYAVNNIDELDNYIATLE